MAEKKPKIAFVSLNIYHLLTRDPDARGVGGAEIQVLFLAEEMRKRGYGISFITFAFNEAEIDPGNRFELIPTFHWSAGLPVVQFIYPRAYKLFRALWRSDVDIFYVNSRGFPLSVVILVAKLRGKKVLFCGASDPDFDPAKAPIGSRKDHFLYFWGLRRCHAYVAQNQNQLTDLEQVLGKSGRIIHYGFHHQPQLPEARSSILWVGRIVHIKAPWHFLTLARQHPGERFVMIGGDSPRGDRQKKRLYDQIREEAAQIPNLEFMDFLPFAEADRYYESAKLLVNTSPIEGFPNTFLQAWARGVPVLSFVNPDNLIPQHQLGAIAEDIDDMSRILGDFSQGNRRFDHAHIKGFFDTNLTIERAVDHYEELFAEMMGARR